MNEFQRRMVIWRIVNLTDALDYGDPETQQVLNALNTLRWAIHGHDIPTLTLLLDAYIEARSGETALNVAVGY
jgi:hypothetical protein